MDMGACLLKEQRFSKKEDGKLDIEEAVLSTCERRRRQILALLNDLMDERGLPILDESRLFRKLLGIEDKKSRCIQPFEKRIERGEIPEGIVPDGSGQPMGLRSDRLLSGSGKPQGLDMKHLCECGPPSLKRLR